MDWAIDPNTKEEVNANNLNVSKYRNFMCPSCEAPVQLRKGDQRIPYFAHAVGKANPNCDKYVPGSYVDKILARTVEQERMYRSLGLYVRTIESNDRYLWHLEIGIPEPDRIVGLLKIPFGYSGERTIPLIQIKSGGLRVRIKPRDSSYHLRVENLTEGDWYNRLTQPINGLSKYSVFRYSSNGGRIIMENRPLYWGRTYLFIWKKGTEPTWFPSSDLLEVKQLIEQDSWTGVILNLPSQEIESIEKWLNELFNRKVEYSPTEISLISPFPDLIHPDGTMVIPFNSDVVISINGGIGTRKWKDVHMYSSNETKIVRHSGNGLTPYLLTLGQLEQGRTDVWIDDDFESGIQLFVTSKTSNATLDVESVKLLGFDNKHQKEVLVNLYSQQTESFFIKWYSKEITLKNIEIPRMLQISIKWRVQWDNRVHERRLSENNSFSTSVQLLNLLNDLLSTNVSYLLIETIGFGKVEINLSDDEIRRQNSIIMSYQWRERMEWLLKQTMTLVDTKIPIQSYCRNLKLDELCEYDQNLMSELCCSSLPRRFISQFNSLVNECINSISKR